MRIFLFFLILFSVNNAFGRELWVDKKEICEQTKGLWRIFNNDCADNCDSKFELLICTKSVNYLCDCGQGRCWDGNKCISEKLAAKIWQEKIIEKEKNLEKEMAKIIKAKKEGKILNEKNQEIVYQEEPKKQDNNLKSENIINNSNNYTDQNNTKLPEIDNAQNYQNNSTQYTATEDTQEKELCLNKGGVCHKFNNGCVDNCNAKVSQYSICTAVIKYGCECGQNRCWDGTSCINIEDYKKRIFNN